MKYIEDDWIIEFVDYRPKGMSVVLPKSYVEFRHKDRDIIIRYDGFKSRLKNRDYIIQLIELLD